MLKIGVLISGGGTNLQALIDNTLNSNINGKIELIISNKDSYGLVRGRKAGIESLYISLSKFENEEDYNKELIKKFKEKDIDLIVLAGYLKILSKEFIKEFKGRIINIHPSLIPKYSGKGYYGEIIHRKVIKSEDRYTGATLHFVDEGIDTGPIILQEKVEVNENDTVESLKEKVLKVEHKIIVQGVKLFSEEKLSLNSINTEVEK